MDQRLENPVFSDDYAIEQVPENPGEQRVDQKREKRAAGEKENVHAEEFGAGSIRDWWSVVPGPGF